MKKILFGIMAILVLTFPIVPVQNSCEQFFLAKADSKSQEEEIKDEPSFWRVFRKVFTRSDPNWNPPSGVTEVAGTRKGVTEVSGVRGIEVEGELKEFYDYDSVLWVERYQIKEQSVRNFLENRKLGPYQPDKEEK